LSPEAKEGLALVNGTQGMLAIGILTATVPSGSPGPRTSWRP
jgi:histidine ammonia-lyase